MVRYGFGPDQIGFVNEAIDKFLQNVASGCSLSQG